MILQENATLQQKLAILSDAAKYDVACTSSGVARKAEAGSIGNTEAAGICHTFSGDGRCISLLKILYTNECVFDCKYCVNRCSNDVPRASFTPEEICTLTMEFYRRNYIEGLFLSSGILHSPNETMEQICKALRDLRIIHRFNGYIHCKAIPGADPALIEMAGWYADRMSINLELPTEEGLKRLAPNKTRKTILTPMRQIQNGMAESREYLGMKGGNYGAYHFTQERKQKRLVMRGAKDTFGTHAISRGVASASGAHAISRGVASASGAHTVSRGVKGVPGTNADNGGYKISHSGSGDSVITGTDLMRQGKTTSGLQLWNSCDTKRGFVPAGQSTQMIVGATPENDFQMLSVTQALYHNFGLKRVFYSAYVPVNEDSHLPSLPGGPPLLREHRLYQADWLLRFYGFKAEELLSEKKPNFNLLLDPKCDWALQNLKEFPVEVNKASYEQLLRVPGVGVKSARRIIAARKQGKLDFDGLKRIGVVLKRARYFITCSGKMEVSCSLDEDHITSALIGDERRKIWDIENRNSYRQLSLFDDMHLEEEKNSLLKDQLVKEAAGSAAFGQL
mgnify:CR=1 FL=1